MANSFSATFPEIFSATMLNTYDKATVMAGLVNRDYEGDIKNSGDIVHAVLFGNVTVSDYTPGSDVSVQNLTLTDYTMPIDQMKTFQAVIDITEIKQSHLPLVKGWLKRGAVAMAETVDDRLLSHHAQFTTTSPGLGTSGTPVTVTASNVHDLFIEAQVALSDAGIPKEDRVAVVDSDTIGIIQKSDKFTMATSTGDMVVRKGEVGYLAGFRVVESQRLAASSGSKKLMFFHRDAISLAFQIPPDHIKTYEPEKQHGTGIKAVALYGSKVFHPTAGCVLYKQA